MPEGKISQLPIQNYKEAPRRVTHVIGETSGIRLIDMKDRVDMRRYKAIDRAMGEEFVDTGSTDRELIEEITDNRPGKEHSEDALYTFGVAGVQNVPSKEKGELQGIINVYRDTSQEELRENGMITSDQQQEEQEQEIFEVAFTKYPKAESHQMASGLRQVCVQLSRMNAEMHSDTKPNFIVTAYVNPDNEESKNVLTASGFVNKGDITITRDEETVNYQVFMLDWHTLNEISHQKADAELLKK